MYVETDFLLALAKQSDWLKGNAEDALEDHDVTTSIVAYTELLLLAEDYDIDRVRAVADLLDIVPVVPEEHQQAVLKAVTYQDEHGMTTFDAIHAGLAETRGERILGTDQAYDELEIDRVPLEPDGE